MASEMFEVTCPCCKAILKVDPETQSVISHKETPKAPAISDLATAVADLKEESARREAMFQKSVEAEKKQADVLSRKFDELLRQAKNSPDSKPIRDFDLD
jgi:hypothetical protein